MSVDEAPRGSTGQEVEGQRMEGQEAGGAKGGGVGDDAEMQEIEDISAKPIFVPGQDTAPPLPERM